MKARDGFVIGKEVGTWGRWFRLILGLYLSALVVLVPLLEDPTAANQTLRFMGSVAAYTLAILAVYTLAFYLLGKPVLERTDPWIGTLIFLGPLITVGALRLGPAPFQVAIGLYYSLSSIFNFAMSYGGCEVVAIPSLFFRRRYTLYCPYNAVDVVERAIRAGSAADTTFGLLSYLITVLVGGFFLLVEDQGVMRQYLDLNVHNAWALTLLVPVGYLSRLTWTARRQGEASEFRIYAIGAVVLGVLMVVFVIGVDALLLWPLAMLLGAGYAIYRLRRRPTAALTS